MIKCTFENGNINSLRHAVVDALVLEENKILLTKRSNKLLEGGKWALIGGFVERDETTEEAIEREVKEETGWTIDNIKFIKFIDDPKRPHEDRQNIAFIFTCNPVRRVSAPDNESEEIKWFDLSDLPDKNEFAFDHYEIIMSSLSRNG